MTVMGTSYRTKSAINKKYKQLKNNNTNKKITFE
jgi:hypothetical protein